MPRDKQGWRVAPAPDGRGTPDEHKPRPPYRRRRFWLFVAAVLAINWILVLVGRPTGDAKATPTALFSTEVPSFWDDPTLTRLLQANHVQVNAKNPNAGPSVLV